MMMPSFAHYLEPHSFTSSPRTHTPSSLLDLPRTKLLHAFVGWKSSFDPLTATRPLGDGACNDGERLKVLATLMVLLLILMTMLAVCWPINRHGW